jgi:hypothetical protein
MKAWGTFRLSSVRHIAADGLHLRRQHESFLTAQLQNLQHSQGQAVFCRGWVGCRQPGKKDFTIRMA